MKYKGYIAKVDFNEKDKVYYGLILDIKDVITFKSNNELNLEKAFQEAVDSFLDFRKHMWLNSRKNNINY